MRARAAQQEWRDGATVGLSSSGEYRAVRYSLSKPQARTIETPNMPRLSAAAMNTDGTQHRASRPMAAVTPRRAGVRE